MNRWASVGACLVVAGAAAVARAELVYPSGVTTVDGGMPSFHVGGTPPEAGFELGAVDGVYLGLGSTVVGPLSGTFTTTSRFVEGEFASGAGFSTSIRTGSIGDATGTLPPVWTVTQVQYSYGDGSATATWGAAQGFAGITMVANADNRLVRDGLFRGGASTTPGFDFAQVDTLTLTWAYAFPDAGFSNFYWMDIDAISAVSNPEPGTMALFGLGALGLGGLAWRRRAAARRRAAPTA